MAKKLSFSIAINLLTENFKKGASQVQSALSQIKGRVLGFAAAIGIGGASLRNFIETASTFEASVSKLSAILGTTPDKIKTLTDNAKKLGETTKYTASEATNLQIELAKLGFNRNEILKSTESILRFAQATDSGLAEAAALAGAALRMFGADVSESKKYVSAMSVATTKSALSFAYLRDALPTVGPVAKAFNFTIEDTLALLGKLADSGFDASSAATATRNILLNLADSSGALAKSLGGNVKRLPELVAGLQKLKERGVDLNTTLQLTDKRSVAAFNAFLQSAGAIEPLRQSITGVEDELDRMAATMGDNVKGAMAGLASAWEALMIKLSESTNNPLKNLIKGVTDIVRRMKNGFAGLVTFVITLISGKLLQAVITFFAKYWALIDSGIAKAQTAEEQKLLATQKRIEAEKVLEAEQTAFETIENGKRLGSRTKIKKAEIALEKATASEKKAVLRAETMAIQAEALKTSTVFGKMGKTIKLAFAGIAKSIKAVFSTVWVTALITAIGTVIGKLVNMYTEAKRVKNIFSDYKKELSSIDRSPEIAQLRVLQKLYNEAAGSKKLQEQYQKRIEDIVGKQISKEQDINAVIRERIRLLEATATADFYTQKKVEAQSKIDELGAKVNLGGISQGNFDYLMQNMAQYNKTGSKKALQTAINTYAEHIRRSGKEFSDDYQNTLLEISGYWQIAKHASSKMENSLRQIVNADINPTGGGITVQDKEKTNLQKEQESYNKQLEELKAELEIGKKTQAEYNQTLGELNVKMYAQAKGTGDKEILESKYFKNLKLAAEKAIQNQEQNTAFVELEKIQRDYSNKLNEYKSQFDRGFISQETLNKNITSLSIEAAKSAAGIKGIGDKADAFISAMQFNAQMLASPIKVKPRDTTFDYKKNEVDIASENLEKAKELADAFKQRAIEMGQTLSDELANAMADVPNLEEALKIAQVRQDIKDFTRELNEGLYSGVKDIASSSDRVVSAFQNLREVMNDVNASGWEKIMSIWNAMTNTVDAFLSVVKTIETITALTKKLNSAQEPSPEEKAAKTVAAKAAETVATRVATETEIQASHRKTESATAEMAAKSTAAYASIPFIGAGLAAAQIAAMTAMIQTAASTVPKFAKGGIITGGPSSGDKILARVNAGEMILNQGQQSRLFDAINSGQIGGSKKTDITIGFDKVRGSDIYLSLKNYMKTTGKKL